MAFRELCEYEIALMDESEKLQYEKELKIYRKRTAFVEKLEQLEKVKIQYQKPKFKRIKPITQPKIPEYKPMESVKIKIPKADTERKLFLQKLESKSESASKVKKRISEDSSVCVRINPISKVAVPSIKAYQNIPREKVVLSKPKVNIPSVSFRGKTKQFISGISDYTKAISVPQCKFDGIKPKEIAVPHNPVLLPAPVKYHFDGSIKIKVLPSLGKIEVPDKAFHAPKCSINNIHKADIAIPDVKFKASKHTIKNMPQVHIPVVNSDFSAVNRQIKDVSLNIQPFEKKTLSVPDIKSQTKLKCGISALPAVPVLIPSVNKFTSPRISVTTVKIKMIKDPCISANHIENITIEADKIPRVNVHMPHYSEVDVKNILNIVNRELQGV